MPTNASLSDDISNLTPQRSGSKRLLKISITRKTVLIAAAIGLITSVPPISITFGIFCSLVLLTILLVDGFFASRVAIVTRLHKSINVRSVKSILAAKIVDQKVIQIRQPIQPEIGQTSQVQKANLLNMELTNFYRGDHLLPSIYFKTTGPLGLTTFNHKAFGLTRYSIYPDLPGAKMYHEMRKRGKLRYETGRMKGKLGLGTEFETIRPYSLDDDFKQINWIATAKTQEPMSNVYRVEENKSVICLLDCGRLMASPIKSATRLDYALDALTYLTVIADDSGDRLGVMAFSDRILKSLPSGRNTADKIASLFYNVQPELTQSDFDTPLTIAAKQKRSLIVIFSDIFDRPSIEPLIEAVSLFLKRHSFLIVSALDTEILDIKTKNASKAEDGARYFVASNFSEEQKEIIKELKFRKINTVIAPPEKLARATADAYFNLRRTANF